MKNIKVGFSLVETMISLVLGAALFFAIVQFFNRSQDSQSAAVKNIASLDMVVMPMRSLKGDLKRARKIIRVAGRDAIELSLGVYDSVAGIVQKTVFYEIVSGPCGSDFKGLTCKTLLRAEGSLADPKPLKFPDLADIQWCLAKAADPDPFFSCENLRFNAPKLDDGNAPSPVNGKRLGLRFSTFTGEKNPVSGLKDQKVVALESSVDLENFDFNGDVKILRFIK